MSNETIVFADPGDTVVVKVRATSPTVSFDARAHRKGLDQYRQFVESHWEPIEHLLGGQPEDQDSLLMDAGRQLPYLIDALRKSKMKPEEVISLTAQILRGSTRWSGPPEKAGDMGQAVVNLLAQVAQGIPKK